MDRDLVSSSVTSVISTVSRFPFVRTRDSASAVLSMSPGIPVRGDAGGENSSHDGRGPSSVTTARIATAATPGGDAANVEARDVFAEADPSDDGGS
ncbi:hypothetical protein [Haloarcula pelagica]|uniref:hypothetical protein n=1 Tax=Haloarcula pelagica TaxID=3033389 RepID=UPI0024C31E47|nr:hypothetical protein [Halomicroarcula sp. YJ-61-S]